MHDERHARHLQRQPADALGIHGLDRQRLTASRERPEETEFSRATHTPPVADAAGSPVHMGSRFAMVATFCLRLALGMIAPMLVLPIAIVPPRFFRVQFLSGLALIVL